MQININGKLLPKEQAKISVFDHSFMYGDGVYDTMRTYEGSVFMLDEHINRLLKSADVINLRLPWSKDELMQQIMNTVQANTRKDQNTLRSQESRIRITVTRGSGESVLDTNVRPNYVIVVEELVEPRKELYEEGVKIISVNIKRYYPTAKSCNSLPNVLAKQQAKKFNAYEAIHCDGDEIKEGTSTNIFIVKNNRIITPKEGILKGITRDVVIKIAKNLYNVEEKTIRRQDLYSAKECFLTGTSKEILPVTKVDNVIIGNGKVGEITKHLIEEFKNKVHTD